MAAEGELKRVKTELNQSFQAIRKMLKAGRTPPEDQVEEFSALADKMFLNLPVGQEAEADFKAQVKALLVAAQATNFGAAEKAVGALREMMGQCHRKYR